MRKDYTGTVDLGSSWEFMNYSKGICKALKATNDRISVIEIINLSERIDMKNDIGKIAKQASNAECRLGNLNGATGGSYAGQVYDKKLCLSYTYRYAGWWQTTTHCGGTEIE